MKQTQDNQIVLFVPTLNGGGAERVMLNVANGLVARGFNVELVLAKAEGPYLQEVSSQIRIVDLQAPRLRWALLPLMRYLRQNKPKLILSALNEANIIVLLARIFVGLQMRIFITEHINIIEEHKKFRGIGSRIVYTLIPWLYPRADGIVAVSLEAARALERFAALPEFSVQCIYNPFELGAIAKLAAEPITHHWFQREGVPVIIGVGRLVEQKDFSTLIKAFALLRKRLQVRLLILGEGRQRMELEALARALELGPDDFQMPGFQRNPFAYLARATLFVLSSRWEGLPSVLVEAMACGKPVVSTDCPSGPREILQDGRWGRLVPVGDFVAMAQAMEEVLNTPREVQPDVRQRAQDFDQERAIDAYLKILGLPLHSLHMEKNQTSHTISDD